MKPLLFLGLIFAVLNVNASTVDEQNLASAGAGFSFRLLKELVKEQPARNIFISPYSASTALQMACNGAGGQTKAEMAKVLGTTGLQQAAINAGTLEIQDSLDSAGTNVVLTTANAMWCRKDFPIKPAFIAINQRFFHAAVENLDFNDPQSIDKMNAWVVKETHGKIANIISPPIDPAMALFLANAVYFKGKWMEPFEKKNTTNRVFHLRGGGQKQVPLMTQTRKFEYRRGTGYQAVRLWYQESSLSMYVFLPDENSSLEKLLSIMNGDNWQRITKPGFMENEGTLWLPKFKMDYAVELKQPLKSLGMNQAFGHADFSGIGDGLFISAVRQKTFVEVNEEGTEAAAVTGMMVLAAGIEMNPPKPFRMVVDRPFLFLIEDDRTGMILFMGTIFDPGV